MTTIYTRNQYWKTIPPGYSHFPRAVPGANFPPGLYGTKGENFPNGCIEFCCIFGQISSSSFERWRDFAKRTKIGGEKKCWNSTYVAYQGRGSYPSTSWSGQQASQVTSSLLVPFFNFFLFLFYVLAEPPSGFPACGTIYGDIFKTDGLHWSALALPAA